MTTIRVFCFLVCVSFLSLLLLAGCAEYRAMGGVYTMETIDAKRDYNDLQAAIVQSAVCETTIGALGRMSEGAPRCSVARLCGLKLAECYVY